MPSSQNLVTSAPTSNSTFPGDMLSLHATSHAGFLAQMHICDSATPAYSLMSMDYYNQGIYLWLFSLA
jgi:hypothetical protein